jgi:hypothetical protein
MKKIIELLTAAEAEAKTLADQNPNSSTAQVLRARILSALEITPHVVLDPKPEPPKK